LRHFDVIIVGGGHAGAEAAWAASRLGCDTALISLDVDRIGQMSCNPAIGGLAKGQMVREVDALGGLMGIAIDNAGIQFRMLNRSKGPAVWGPRAQADKYKYAREVQRLLRTCDRLTIVPGEVAQIEAGRHPEPMSIQLADGQRLTCKALIITTGTFMKGLMHTGEQKTEGGRVGEASARTISDSLREMGLDLGRLKTGTPPRLHKDSIDYSRFELQPGDDEPMPFSFLNEYPTEANRSARFEPPLRQVPCWLGKTNPAIHDIIRANLHRAPMFSGQIRSTGPRYCPSIEDKVHRFADKESHQIFLEPEGLDTDEIYVNGISTSLPADVQEQFIRMVPGLEHAKILRFGYAVEYDMVWPSQIDSTLQVKSVPGLFLAGQINGTSGYEEAAGQGLMAGVNAARLVKHGHADFVLRRDQAYIGVLIDDLVTKPPIEPYRMFTSRAEHRLSLRGDNADERLTPIGRSIGLVDDARWNGFESRQADIESILRFCKVTRHQGNTLEEILRRPDRDWTGLPTPDDRPPGLSHMLAETRIKYAGYIEREHRDAGRLVKLEEKLIPTGVDYHTIAGLRNEAKLKLSEFTPRSLGQALRISGITPADITLLAIHLDRKRR
jgi:tRNA uridine 5-carboxymethylaminomethyl modification enzyme